MLMNSKGIVLISVLLIVLMLSVISVSIGKYYFLSSKREGYVDFQNDAIQYMANVETLAIKEIKKHFRFNRAHTAKNQTLFTDPIYLELEKGTLQSTLKDASSCFNINALLDFRKEKYILNQKAISAFEGHLKLLDYDASAIDALTDQIIDWIDVDNEPRSNGLEDYFYIGPMNDSKQFTSKRYFYHLSEIKNLPASAYFDWSIIKEHFCVIPLLDEYSININFLEADNIFLLAAAIPDVSLGEAEEILNAIPLNGFKSISDLKNAYPNINFDNLNIPISFNSQLLFLDTEVSYADFNATSQTLMNYNNNKVSIIFRSYNGI